MTEPLANLWVMEVDEKSCGVYCSSDDLLRLVVKTGVSPEPARVAIERVIRDEPVSFFFVNKKGKLFKGDVKEPPDLAFWGWIPVFSELGRETAIALGADAGEFLECNFEQVERRRFFLHLPNVTFSIVDFGNSTFMMWIQANPPIPHRIELAKLICTNRQVPPCFRVAIPGHPQVLTDLFVTEALVLAWQQRRAIGAKFRQVTQNDA